MYLHVPFTNGSGKTLNGTNLTNMECAAYGALGVKTEPTYYYFNNVKTISLCENDGWSNGKWNNSSGTYVNSTFPAFGVNSTWAQTTATNHGVKKVVTLDLTKSNNGQPMDDTAFISFFLYVTDVNYANLGSDAYIEIIFPNDNSGTLTNYAYYRVLKSNITENTWNPITIRKSNFTQVGTFSWSTVKGVSFSLGGTINGAGCYFIVDNILLIRQDPLNTSYPNPAQRRYNGSYYPDISVSTSGNNLVCAPWELLASNIILKNVSTNYIDSNKGMYIPRTFGAYARMQYVARAWTNSYMNNLYYYVDSNNYIQVTIYNNNFKIIEKINGSIAQTIETGTISSLITLNTDYSIYLFKEDTYYSVELILSNSESFVYDRTEYPCYGLGLVSNIGNTGQFRIDNNGGNCNGDMILYVDVKSF